jgi:hypothetical protein
MAAGLVALYPAIAAMAGALGGAALSYVFYIRSEHLPSKEWFSRPRIFTFLFFSSIAVGMVLFIRPETPLSGFWLGFLSSTVFDVLLVVPFEDKRTVEIRKNLLRAEAAIEREPEKARTIWDFSRLQLEILITLNLAQVRRMFFPDSSSQRIEI